MPKIIRIAPAKPAPALPYPRASLLGLPAELRLQIYEEVIHEEVNYNPIARFWEVDDIREIYFVRVRNPEARLHLSWIQLLRCCHTTAEEVRGMVEGLTGRESNHHTGEIVKDAARTWVMTLGMPKSNRADRNVTWQRIPCAPSEVRHLEMHCQINDTE
jgi:hypothetical protein